MSRSVKKKASYEITSISSIVQSYQILMLVLRVIICKQNSNTNQTENEQLTLQIGQIIILYIYICKVMQCMIGDLNSTKSNDDSSDNYSKTSNYSNETVCSYTCCIPTSFDSITCMFINGNEMVIISKLFEWLLLNWETLSVVVPLKVNHYRNIRLYTMFCMR